MGEVKEGGRPEGGNWWTRPCGGGEVLRIALPLVISTGFWSIMLFVDRMFLFWHSEQEMAAAMPAGMLYWTMISFPLGVAGYVNTFVAQYHGAGRPNRIGPAVGQGVWVGLIMVPVFLATIPLAPFIFRAFGHPPALLPHETVYFQICAVGAGAAVISSAQAAFFTGRGVTWVEMVVNVAMTAANIALDYVMVFGKLGCPELGIAGAAWATVICLYAKVLVYWALFQLPSLRQCYHLFEMRRLDGALMRRLWRFGGPNGFHFLIEGLAFSLIILLMAQLGDRAMAATTMAFNVNMVAFVPMFGVSIAVSTLVGQQIAAGRSDLAARATWTALVMAVAYTGLFGAGYVFVPDLFLLGHASGAEAAEFAEVRDLTVLLLRFVAAYCIFDAMQIIFVSAIKGAGDTRFVLMNTIVVSALGVTIGIIGNRLAGPSVETRLFWWWTLISGWILTLGLIYLLRFLQGRWRTMRVIEEAPTLEPVKA